MTRPTTADQMVLAAALRLMVLGGDDLTVGIAKASEVLLSPEVEGVQVIALREFMDWLNRQSLDERQRSASSIHAFIESVLQKGIHPEYFQWMHESNLISAKMLIEGLHRAAEASGLSLTNRADTKGSVYLWELLDRFTTFFEKNEDYGNLEKVARLRTFLRLPVEGGEKTGNEK